MLENIKTLSVLQYKADWQSARVHQLSKNIANAETPNYQRQDIKDFVTVLRAHAPQIRQAKDIGTPPLNVSSSDHQRTGGELVREKEVMQLNETVTDHQATIQLFKKFLSMIRTVTGK